MDAILNGQLIRTESDFHAAIARGLGFPAHYGQNLDALWDCLTGDVEKPASVTWLHADASRLAMGARFDEIVRILKKAEAWDAKHVAIRDEVFRVFLK